MQSYAGAAVLTLTETNKALFLRTLPYTKGPGGLHYLLAKRPVNILMALFLDNCPENSFSLEVFLFTLHNPQSTK